MAKIALSLIKSRPNCDGTYRIKFKISNGRSSTYISSDYTVAPNQWSQGKVVRHPQASIINAKLFQQLAEYSERLNKYCPGPDMTAAEIAEIVKSNKSESMSVISYIDDFISTLRQNGQTSYATNMSYTRKWFDSCFGSRVRLSDVTCMTLDKFERFLLGHDQSCTTVNIRMSHLKAVLNMAVNEGIVDYRVFPFRNYRMPQKNVRDIALTKSELLRLRDYNFNETTERRYIIARDLFMLSFYCAGINLIDLMSASLKKDILTFTRKKTADKKRGANKEVSITIQPEAREIITKYITPDGALDFGYKYSDYGQFRSYVTKTLSLIGERFEFENKLMFYSARKTFVQLGSELGIPLYILEYAIGQTIKEANNRPVFNYLKVMRSQADLAIRTILDYVDEEDEEEAATPLPEWARRHKR